MRELAPLKDSAMPLQETKTNFGLIFVDCGQPPCVHPVPDLFTEAFRPYASEFIEMGFPMIGYREHISSKGTAHSYVFEVLTHRGSAQYEEIGPKGRSKTVA